MLRITVEMLPFGSDTDKYVIGQFDVGLQTSHPKFPEMANYMVKSKDSKTGEHSFVVKNHKRADGAYVLVKLVMNGLKKQLKALKKCEITK